MPSVCDLRLVGILCRRRRLGSGEVFEPTNLAGKPLFTLKYSKRRMQSVDKRLLLRQRTSCALCVLAG